MMPKWRVFCSFAPSSLLWGGWGIIVSFYSVQDCSLAGMLYMWLDQIVWNRNMHVFMCTVTKVATLTKKECVICFIASNFRTPWNTITNRYVEILSSSKQKDQLKLPEGSVQNVDPAIWIPTWTPSGAPSITPVFSFVLSLSLSLSLFFFFFFAFFSFFFYTYLISEVLTKCED